MPSMTAKVEDLAEKMKDLEMQEAGRKALPGIPLIARLDGRAFHTFTKGMERPYDIRMMAAMQSVTKVLVQEFKPVVGYTQSDEISLVFLNPEVLFGGRYQKLHSVLAGYASSYFSAISFSNASKFPDWPRNRIPCFDCRVWQVPDHVTALEALVWREDDATKNSVSMLAQAHFSHSRLHGKGSKEMHDMLHDKGVNWNDQPTHFKRGVYLKHRVVNRVLTKEEREAIKEPFRPEPGTLVTRGEVYVLDFPPVRSLDPQDAVLRLFSKEDDRVA